MQYPFQAKRELVESYKRLRTEDAAPGSSTSYRCYTLTCFPGVLCP